MKVLIIEDNPITSLDLQDILELKGFEANVANNFKDAIDMFHSLKPDIALVDINLNGEKDGIDLVNEIKHSTSIPIVYLTGNSDETTRSRAIKSGASSFLTKPFREVELTSALEIAFLNKLLNNTSLYSAPENKYTFLKSGNSNSFVKVHFDNILYLKAEGSYTAIITEDDEFLLSYNLNQIEEKLSHNSIVRIHRSWSVNMRFVDSITRESVIVKDLEIPIGRKYREFVNGIINKVG